MSEHTGGTGASLATVRDALHSAGQFVRPRGADAFMASCPLHIDHSPSLSVTWRAATTTGRGGAVLLHCFSCSAAVADIAGALGLRVTDLFDSPLPTPTPDKPRSRPAARRPARAGSALRPLPPRITAEPPSDNHHWRRVRVYTYTDQRGRPVQQVIRQECCCTGQQHKRFQQRYRVGRQWVYRKPPEFTPVLYRAAAIATAQQTGQPVWIVEGEKDADTLTAAGRLATTNPQGAANFPPALLAQFEGLRVAVVADRDLSGYRRATALSAQLRGVATEVTLLLPALEADKADLTDHIEGGLWDPAHPCGGLLEVTAADLHALTLAALAAQAAHRCAIAITEHQAHQALWKTGPGSVQALARWRAEAGHQLRIVTDSDQQLQRHARENPSALAHHAVRATAAVRSQIHDTYRGIGAGHDGLKESA
ncbi:hypothetical protein [Mycobacterium sp. TY815]|uniref:hypothetical protein n=1 Tax=unclassified Mycobacterium TaxID=2642494 RepID=UPI00274065C4|nr:hypothetical protein [Mycobacterium sp. TY815]MDP7706922.1 hypothetical protein [Mycobacterium sp. TY815]